MRKASQYPGVVIVDAGSAFSRQILEHIRETTGVEGVLFPQSPAPRLPELAAEDLLPAPPVVALARPSYRQYLANLPKNRRRRR